MKFYASVLFTQMNTHTYIIILITHEINRRLDNGEEKISELEKIVKETIQNETEKENLWNNFKLPDWGPSKRGRAENI